MKTLFCLLSLLACTSLFSQNRRTSHPAKDQPDTVHRDTTVEKRKPAGRMPNAITSMPPSVYKGNNGRGFDVYQSTLDGMPVLKPDSANRATLQMNASGKIKKEYKMPGTGPKIYRVPRKN